MKKWWNIVSFLAIAHLLAMMMFIGWLWQSGRLDTQRVQHLRETFSMTIAEAEQAQADALQQAQDAELEALAQQRRTNPPLPSDVRITRISRLEEIEQRTFRRIEQEKAMLREQIATAQARLDERESRLDQQRQQWIESVEAERERRTDEQFAKTVKQYESVRPKQGKEMLMQLIAAGEMQQAVAYLDAMNARAASRILGEFKAEDEITLATELLEQLRTFGVPDVDSQDTPETPDAANVADAR